MGIRDLQAELKPGHRLMTEIEKICVTCQNKLDKRGGVFSHYDNWQKLDQAARFNCYDCIPGYVKVMSMKEDMNL